MWSPCLRRRLSLHPAVMIDPSTQLAAMIRAQFAAQFRAQAKSQERGREADEQAVARRNATGGSESTSSGASGRSAAGSQAAATPNAQDARLQQLVALRVSALSPNDPQRERKAFRLFLESVLIQAFGRDRLDERGFDQMVNTVLQRMENDTELQAALREAGGLLLSEAQQAGTAPR